MKIPFSPPYIDDSVVAEVTDSLRSGWITTGPKVKALEEEIKQRTGAGAVLGVSSWTIGAIMTLRWLGVKPGDEVIVPAYTYCATALAVIWAGAKPVMVDVGPDFNISIEAIRRAITPRTKAIIPVDIAGWPCDYRAIMQLVQEPDIVKLFQPTSPIMERMGRITVINDSAHSIGSHYEGRFSGSETDIAIFSLHAVKNVTTAEGGAICLNMPAPFDNEQLYKDLRLMSLNCQTKDAFTKSKAGGWRYDIVGMGMKANLADVNAAIGLAQIRQYDQLLARRKQIFQAYDAALGKHPWAILPPSADGRRESSYHVYALRIDGISEAQRDAIIDEISKHQVAVNVHFIPLPMLTLFSGMGYRMEDYPQTYRNFAHEISLPSYPQMTDEQVAFVVKTVTEAYETVIGETAQ
ncbi:MAG: DegT/DnrJ/EryC1/StrS family aminotransferase [Prevotella sp.]|nr:DegT/DnrJ/EryC1/StrS family aminotransferase [Prevotella sp.]